MTSEDVREALGLKPWDQAFVEGIQWLCGHAEERGYRDTATAINERHRTGRTTKVIVEAVTAAMNGENIQLRAWNPSQEDYMVTQAREWVKQLGGDPSRIIGRTPSYPGSHREMWDHYSPKAT